jgi:hypothetical protein
MPLLSFELLGVCALGVDVCGIFQPVFAEQEERFGVDDVYYCVVGGLRPCFHVLGGIDENASVFAD